ncbi:Trafficking protein particle complex subunit 12 [Phytophthora citrophthora]|uniref:Trafficking protein particle complex subunit 12 n=1 Tax=Phytophthora citrophthora TaxID=4793 RepID=A0AAD9GYF0_9STRA|nr:Trafficking protein particle complex subunit 12 [Phytophthora citrophthora]
MARNYMANRFPSQQAPTQDTANARGTAAPSASRASPFASGPVAMVNQVRPGFGAPGQFPGHTVRATPTQLSTPLVPQRHSSLSSASHSPDPSPLFGDKPSSSQPDTDGNLFGQAAATQSAADLFGQSTSAPPQQYQSSTDPFGSPSGPVPQFQMQLAGNEVSRGASRTLPEELFGPSSAPGQPSQRNAYENLFGSPDSSSSSTAPKLSRHSSLSSSQGPTPSPFSKSLPPPAQHRANPYQQEQQSSTRSFGQTPPPAAPFLGYTDNTRSQSFRAPAASAATPGSLFSEARKVPSPVRSTPPAQVPLLSPPRITIEAPSPDDLVDEFLKMPVDERFAGSGNAAPPASKLLLADVPDTVQGLEALYAQRRWKSLTKKALSMLQNPSKDINVTLEIKSWWLAGLIKEGHYDNAASVLDQIGNIDEVCGTGGGTPFVPVRLLLLRALLNKCQGKSVNHEKQLFHLIMRLRSAIQQNETMSHLGVDLEAAARWLRIAQFALTNYLVHQQKFSLALRICSQIDVQHLDDQETVVVLSRVGRIRLQMGDLSAAEKMFEAARYRTNLLKQGNVATANVVGELEARLLLNDGLLLFAQNKLQEALSAFDSILYLQNAQTATTASSDADVFLDEDVVCSAVNNYAICALYCCDVKAAVVALERMIRSNPQRFLNGVVVFNLSSLYDLLFDNATSKSRKEMMKKIAHLYDLEHVDPATYRI